MKRMKTMIGIGVITIASAVMVAADHIDAPAVMGGTADITDFYAFEATNNSSNVVFAANVQGLISPNKTGDAKFDENVLIEFNIDTDNDNVEDLIIQAIPRGGKMYFFGPIKPSSTGLNSTVMTGSQMGSVDITKYGESAKISNENGMSFFAGPRDDPFFMDFARYGEIIQGNATGFNDPGADTFAGTNVMSIVVELPKSMVGSSGTINTWVEAKRK